VSQRQRTLRGDRPAAYARTLEAARRALGMGAPPSEAWPPGEAPVPVWVEGRALLLEQAIAVTLGGAPLPVPVR
jgi:hypothetical protein